MFRDNDFIKRMISQLGDVLKKALGLRRSRKFDEALQLLDGARQDLVAVPRSLLDQLDAPGSAALIGDAPRIRVWARLVHEEAMILQDQGVDATNRFRDSVELMLEAIARSSATLEDRTLLVEWSESVPTELLRPEAAKRLDVVLTPQQ